MPTKSIARKGWEKPIRAEPDSSATDSQLDSQKGELFVSPQASLCFNSCMIRHNLLMEKGFTFKQSNILQFLDFVRHVIKGHQWIAFCSTQPAATFQLMCEFYANYDPVMLGSVYIKNQHIPFIAEDINRLYNLPDVKETFFDSDEDLDDAKLDEILPALCVEGATWKRASHDSMTFPHTFLKPDPSLWYHFLKFWLMPSTHNHVIHRERAARLYCIVEGLTFNVGVVIKQQIGICAGHNSGGLWFPFLITQLCRAHNVQVMRASCISSSLPRSHPLPYHGSSRRMPNLKLNLEQCLALQQMQLQLPNFLIMI